MNPELIPESGEKEEKFQFVDRKSSEIMEALAKAPLFRKQGRVNARLAAVGEEITTTLESGATETKNKAKEGEWVVTNPSGGQYIISNEKFTSRYAATEQEGVYSAKGYCRAIQNPFGKPIKIMASWGEPQTGDENCMIADTCDEKGVLGGEPYIIDASAFATTYIQVENE